jgi:hypothetical protein
MLTGLSGKETTTYDGRRADGQWDYLPKLQPRCCLFYHLC